MRYILLVLIGLAPSCQKENDTLFTPVPEHRSGLDFVNQLEESEAFNILEYLYFYNGGGIASGDINNDGLPDLYFTSNQGEDKLYLNQGQLQFKEITKTAGVGGETGIHKWTTGATMVDINADGFPDIYVCEVDGYNGLQGRNRLYINNGGVSFKEEAAAYGLDISSYAQQAAFFDFDLDGDLDMFLLNHAVHTPDSYKRAKIRLVKDSLAGDRLLRNDDGFFKEITEQAGIYNGAMGYGLAVSIGDINNDGFPDIYISNDFHENDYLYFNQGDGTFREGIEAATGHVSTFSMGNDIADVNNDGWLDILTADMKPEEEPILKTSSGVDPYDVYQYKLNFGYHYQYSRNMLQLNQGLLPGADQVKFSEVGQLAGVAATDWSWSALFADLDNNGYKDIFITNGIPTRPNDLDYTKYTAHELASDSLTSLEIINKMPSGLASNYAFQNKGLKFTNRSKAWGLDLAKYSSGAICTDLDQDGDLDLLLNNLNEQATLFQNLSREKEQTYFIKVALQGSPLNPAGIGTRVELYSGDLMQVLENQLTRGWLSSNHSHQFHFGLGNISYIDSLIVIWPDGRHQVHQQVPINTTLEVDYKKADPVRHQASLKQGGLLADISDKSGIGFKHQEVIHNDFSKEKLIPRLLSSEGPKIAVGDVNGDGWEDCYISGGKGQPGALYLQQKKEKTLFRLGNNEVFQDQWAYEDVGAAFFDADQDGDLDLYVVSGGGEHLQGASLQDRLYFNDGKGNFRLTTSRLPNLEFNGSCVVPFDANDDGLTDLFIGNRSVPLQYGLPGVSRFLLNKGDGKFLDATPQMLEKGGRIGMVTDAVWIDQRKELVIVGEWMPVTIYSFRDGNIERKKLEKTSGWWNTVEAADIDLDGDPDLLLGNTGINTHLSASTEEPLDLYVSDYDKNLSTDPIMAYYKNGKQWVYPDLDLLAQQIVGVKNKYLSYRSYANSTFTEIFPPELLAKSYHAQAQTLHSAILEYDEGQYHLNPLPDEGQTASIFAFAVDDFDGDSTPEIIGGGNFYGNSPSIGRADASYGFYFEVNKTGNLVSRPLREVGFALFGEVRDLKIIKGANGEKFLLAARNNDLVKVFQVSHVGTRHVE